MNIKDHGVIVSRWYTATEVGTHCSVTDCWVTISGRVYDVTPLFDDNPPLLCEVRALLRLECALCLQVIAGPLSMTGFCGLDVQPIIMEAGKDISHWFEPRTFDVDEKEIDVEVLLWFHPVMHINTYFTPQVHKYSLHFLIGSITSAIWILTCNSNRLAEYQVSVLILTCTWAWCLSVLFLLLTLAISYINCSTLLTLFCKIQHLAFLLLCTLYYKIHHLAFLLLCHTQGTYEANRWIHDWCLKRKP